MKRAWNYIVTMWQPAILVLVGISIIASLFAYRIGNLVPGVSRTEMAGRNSSLGINKIINNPVNAPYKVARYTARKIHNSMSSERIVSGIVAGLSIVLFYLTVKRFCSRFATALATIMFSTSSSLLTMGRQATPEVLLLMLLGLLACGYYLRFNSHTTRSWILVAIALSLSLYVPGMLYFILGGILWQFKAIKRDRKWPKKIVLITCISIFSLLLSPLIYGFIQNPGIWREYFGIPAQLPNVMDFLKSAAAVPFGIFVWAPKNALYRLGRQPTLDIFGSVMFILGCYTLIKRYRLDRLVLLLGIFIMAVIYTSVSGNYENSFVLLPFIYLCIAVGIGMLLDRWRATFPLNPLARGLALTVIAIAVIISSNFQARRYFIAWPHNANTRALFTLK